MEWRVAELNVREIQDKLIEKPEDMFLSLQLIMKQNISLARKTEYDSSLAAYGKAELQNKMNQMAIEFNAKFLEFEAKQKDEWAKEITRYIEENNQKQKEEISKAISEFTAENNKRIEELIKRTNQETTKTLELTIQDNQDKLFEQINIRINQTEEQFAANARKDWEFTKSQINNTNTELEKAKTYIDQLQSQYTEFQTKQQQLNDNYKKDLKESKELIQQEISKIQSHGRIILRI